MEDEAPQEGQGRNNDIGTFRKLLQDQQNSIEELLHEQKTEFVEKVDPKRKHNFNQKILEKQFDVNKNFLRIAKKIEKSLKKQQVHVAKTQTETLIEDLETHEEDLIAADVSRNGWLTVARL